MEYEMKADLAALGKSDEASAGRRLKAARALTGLSQAELGEKGSVKKAAISNAEGGRAFPNRDVMLYLFKEHRVDANFMLLGHFAQLPGDVQDQLFAILQDFSVEETAKGG